MNMRKLESEQMNVNEAVSDFKLDVGIDNEQARLHLEKLKVSCGNLISAAQAVYNLSLYQNILEKV